MEKRNNSRMGPLEETLSKSKIEPTGQREIYRFKPKTAVTKKRSEIQFSAEPQTDCEEK